MRYIFVLIHVLSCIVFLCEFSQILKFREFFSCKYLSVLHCQPIIFALKFFNQLMTQFLLYLDFDQFYKIKVQVNSINYISIWILSIECNLIISYSIIWRKLFIYFEDVLISFLQGFVLFTPILEMLLRKILLWIFLSEDDISSWLSIT